MAAVTCIQATESVCFIIASSQSQSVKLKKKFIFQEVKNCEQNTYRPEIAWQKTNISVHVPLN